MRTEQEIKDKMLELHNLVVAKVIFDTNPDDRFVPIYTAIVKDDVGWPFGTKFRDRLWFVRDDTLEVDTRKRLYTKPKLS